MEHHEFSPSSLEQYRLCPGSYCMQKGIPEKESEYAKEGTLLHEAVATRSFDGLNNEQKAVVESCIWYLDSRIKQGDEVYNELELELNDTKTGEVITYGFADVVIVNKATNKLVLIDWKFGYSPVKDVNCNIQLAAYSAMAMQRFGIDHCDANVYQPRIYKMSNYTFSNTDGIICNIRRIVENAKNDGSLVLRASEDACRYCRARLGCPAFRVKFQRLTAVRGDYDMADIPTLEKLFATVKGAKSFITEVENAVRETIEKEGRCGRYGFQVSEGAREVKDLNALYGLVKDYLTPAEFNSVCKVTLGKFENLLADKFVAEAEVRGEKLPKAKAKAEVFGMISGLVTRGNPVKKIIEVA